MPTHIDRQLAGHKNLVAEKTLDYFDSTVANLSEIIGKDYFAIVREHVVPAFKDEVGLKHRELRILACLGYYDVALTPADLAALLRFDPATVTRALTILEKAGFLTRKVFKEDSRSVLVELTSEGRDLAERFTARVKDVLKTLENTLKEALTLEEKAAYFSMTAKLVDRYKEMRANSKYI